MNASCATCRFADPVIGDDASLFLNCRRFPPQVIVLDGEPVMFWPQVAEDGWCGEWSAT